MLPYRVPLDRIEKNIYDYKKVREKSNKRNYSVKNYYCVRILFTLEDAHDKSLSASECQSGSSIARSRRSVNELVGGMLKRRCVAATQ